MASYDVSSTIHESLRYGGPPNAGREPDYQGMQARSAEHDQKRRRRSPTRSPSRGRGRGRSRSPTRSPKRRAASQPAAAGAAAAPATVNGGGGGAAAAAAVNTRDAARAASVAVVSGELHAQRLKNAELAARPYGHCSPRQSIIVH
jgi:hypothetical protein